MGGAQFVHDDVVLVARHREALLGGPQRLMEPVRLRRVAGGGGRRGRGCVRRATVEKEHRRRPGARRRRARCHLHHDAACPAVERHGDRGRQHRLVAVERGLQREFEVEPQLRPHEAGKLACGQDPVRRHQEPFGGGGQVQHAMVLVDDGAGWRHVMERGAVPRRGMFKRAANVRRQPIPRGGVREETRQAARHGGSGPEGVPRLALAAGLEQTGPNRRLGVPKKEEAPRTQGEMEQRADLLLKLAVEVDQEVAARDEIEPQERRIPDHAVLLEQHELPDAVAHAVARPLVDEEAVEAIGADVGRDRLRVSSLTGDGERMAVEIGGDDLDPRLDPPPRRLLEQQDREAVRLLAGGAAGHPDADGVAQVGRVEEGPDGTLRQRFERMRVAEEHGDGDEEIGEQSVGLPPVLAHRPGVGGKGRMSRDLHPTRHPAREHRALVAGHIVPGALLQPFARSATGPPRNSTPERVRPRPLRATRAESSATRRSSGSMKSAADTNPGPALSAPVLDPFDEDDAAGLPDRPPRRPAHPRDRRGSPRSRRRGSTPACGRRC